MSCFYACDYCEHNLMDVWLSTCHCEAQGMQHVGKVVVSDGQDIKDACPLVKQKGGSKNG